MLALLESPRAIECKHKARNICTPGVLGSVHKIILLRELIFQYFAAFYGQRSVAVAWINPIPFILSQHSICLSDTHYILKYNSVFISSKLFPFISSPNYAMSQRKSLDYLRFTVANQGNLVHNILV